MVKDTPGVWVNSNGYITFGATAPLASANSPFSIIMVSMAQSSGFGMKQFGSTAIGW